MALLTCLANRPPLVVFVLGLFAFALTTVLLAAAVSSKDRLRNPDALDWDTFLGKVTRLEYCLHGSSSSNSNNRSSGSSSNDTVSAGVLVPISTEFLREFHDAADMLKWDKTRLSEPVLATGSLLMDHLDRGRLAKYHGMTVQMTLALPGVGNWTNSNSSDRDKDEYACVGLTAPSKLLSDLNLGSSPDSCQPSSSSDLSLSFETHSADHLPSGWCPEDSSSMPMRLSYYEERPDWVVYLSEEDRRLVHLHLAATSAFLFALGAAAVVVAALRSACGQRRPPPPPQAIAAGLEAGGGGMSPPPPTQPSRTTKKSSSDGRGDMQLLPQNG